MTNLVDSSIDASVKFNEFDAAADDDDNINRPQQLHRLHVADRRPRTADSRVFPVLGSNIYLKTGQKV